MATLKPELRAILEKYGINPKDTSQVWDCRGILVLYHKAYEIIAAKEGIKFDPPQVIRGNKDEAVIVVAGRMGERVEWSFGEAAIGQNYQVSGKQAAYPYAMAEKRAKDRVIAKLAGLAAYVHSEDEADEFKDGERKSVDVPENGNGHAKPEAPAEPPEVANAKKMALVVKSGIDAATKPNDTALGLKVAGTGKDREDIATIRKHLGDGWADRLHELAANRILELSQRMSQ